jgi:hypothetical protein
MALDARNRDGNRSRAYHQNSTPSIVRLDPPQRRWLPPGAGWESLRGDILTRATVEVLGGFPGSIAHAAQLRQARLAISESWLTVNDGRTDGFAIPFDLIDSISVVPGSLRSRYAIQIRYKEGIENRFFYLKFPEPVWPFRTGDDALRLASLLCDLGIDAIEPPSTSLGERLAMSVNDARSAAMETMVWSGEITGPINGRAGRERTACHAWLTTTSFIWRAIDGSGIHRLALTDLASVVSSTWVDKGPYPVVMMTMYDDDGDLHELPFIFDTSSQLDANRREWAAMLSGLRMREVRVSRQARPLQPWHNMASLMDATDATTAEPEMPAAVPVSPGAFEAHCLAEIARLNRDILGTPASSGHAQLEPVASISHVTAVAELDRLFHAGELTRKEMLKYRRRFSALIEARGKLAAIAEQRAQAIRPRGILLHQREAVMSSLNNVLIPDPTLPVPDQATEPIPSLVDPGQPRLRLRVVR